MHRRLTFPAFSWNAQLTSPLIACLTAALFGMATRDLSSVDQVPVPPLLAGAAKVNIASPDAGPANDGIHARALVFSQGDRHAVIVSVDAVAIGEIGPIKNDYLGKVRSQLETELGIAPQQVMINATHCHAVVASNVDELTVQAVREAWENRVPVRVGAATGHEDRISSHRRLKQKDGSEVDVRHAYPMPRDEDQADTLGPIDPAIEVLRVDREDSSPLAVLYQFAIHPIMGVPSGKNTADLTGFSSQVIEDQLGPGAVALFLQGCGGDINPVRYKAPDQPRDAETLGNLLALSTLKTVRSIESTPADNLLARQETLTLPRSDSTERIARLEAEIARRLASLSGTTLDFKTFVPLYIKYHLSGEYPAQHAHRYLRDELMERDDWQQLDQNNRRTMEQYLANIHTMEELVRLQTNLALLKKHRLRNAAAGRRIDVELMAFRVGDFRMLTFPGELTVQIGLNIKQADGRDGTCVSGYTNGYIYYAPTAEQLNNPGYAQEDCDTLLAQEWQEIFEKKAAEILLGL